MCFPFFHKWKVVACDRVDIYDNCSIPEYGLTYITSVCEKCGDLKEKTLKGHYFVTDFDKGKQDDN